MTIALERVRAVSLAYRTLGPGPIVSTDKVVDLILRDSSLRVAFEYERHGETEVLSRPGIKRWLRTARYWGIVAQDLLHLTTEGMTITEGEFNNLFQRQLARVVQEQWHLDLQIIEARLTDLRVASREGRPDIRNWHRVVDEISTTAVPRVRFGQLVGFLQGLGVIQREICHLYFVSI